MEYVKSLFLELSEDQKKFGVIIIAVLFLLLVYAVSKNSESSSPVIVEPTKKSFKGGDIVSNNAADYYKNKGSNMARQYEEVKSSQKLLEDQLKEIKIALEKQSLEKERYQIQKQNSSTDQLYSNHKFPTENEEPIGKKIYR